jgi:hypothetical protein
MAQPYGNFVKALLEKQNYPNLKDEKGNPIQPYDVTAHTLPLLMNVEAIPVLKTFQFVEESNPVGHGSGSGCGCGSKLTSFGIYHSEIPSMDEGWTRWATKNADEFRACCTEYLSITNTGINSAKVNDFKSIIFPDQSPSQILNGYAKGSMPDEFTGGVGKEGVANLRKFAEAGGTLVFLNRASEFAIKQFDLPIKDVTDGLNRKDFFIPGSILRTEIDTAHPIAKGMPAQSIAWFEDSPAFEITDAANVKVIARYPTKTEEILLSGWALGAEKLTGKAALVEVKMGKGKIVLFGFRPQYRGQSLATFPLLFNAIAN